jgi:transposase
MPAGAKKRPACGGEMAYLSEVSAEQLELVASALK